MAYPEWRAKAKSMIADGFGVEDVALELGVARSDVRLLVAAMRGSGVLADMFSAERQGAGE